MTTGQETEFGGFTFKKLGEKKNKKNVKNNLHSPIMWFIGSCL